MASKKWSAARRAAHERLRAAEDTGVVRPPKGRKKVGKRTPHEAAWDKSNRRTPTAVGALIDGQHHLAERVHKLERTPPAAEQERRLKVLESHVLERTTGPDYEPDITIKIAQLRHDIRVLEQRLLEDKPVPPALVAQLGGAPLVARDVVERLIKQSFEGAPEWNAIGMIFRKLLEGLAKL